MSIIFARTRYIYDSYIDFWTLVELAGFPTCYVDEVDVSQEAIYITAPHNGEWNPHIDNQDDRPRNAHLILWNIERPSGSAGSVGHYGKVNRELIYKRYFDEVWTSDRRLAQETQLRFVVLGSHPGLGEPGNEKQYEFCHMSYEVPRRVNIYKHFSKDVTGPNCWPPERDEVLRRSRFALNVHQDLHPFQEPLRFALFAAYGLPIVSETIYDSYPWSDEFMYYAEYDALVGKLKQLTNEEYRPHKELGERARQRMTEEFEFGKMVRQALDESVFKWR
jgi:hypothetical protein